MSIPVQCSQCGQRYRVREHLAGKVVRCKNCGQELQVREEPELPILECDETEPEAAESDQVIRHAPRRTEFQPAVGDCENIEAISNHIESHLGEVEMVFHELVSDLVHIDVHHVKPAADRPYHTLITSGMSDRAMTVPEGAEAYRYAELMISLPASWPIDMEAFKDERHYWPVRWLKRLARLPHEYETWLFHGHTVPNGEPAEPFAPNTKLCCALLLVPELPPEDFFRLPVDEEKTIHFFSFVPLYAEEMEFKLQHGADALHEKLQQHGVTELLDIKRKNVCKRRGWPF